MIYEDVGAIFHAPLRRLYKDGEHEYGPAVRRLIWVAALQRLANGVGVRLLADSVFRKEYAKDNDFEDDNVISAFVFRVVVAHDEYGTTIRKVKRIPVIRKPVRDGRYT